MLVNNGRDSNLKIYFNDNIFEALFSLTPCKSILDSAQVIFRAAPSYQRAQTLLIGTMVLKSKLRAELFFKIPGST